MTLVIGSLQLGFLYGILALGIAACIPHFKYSGSDGGGEFYAGTGSLGSLHPHRLPGQQLWPGRWLAV